MSVSVACAVLLADCRETVGLVAQRGVARSCSIHTADFERMVVRTVVPLDTLGGSVAVGMDSVAFLVVFHS